MTTPSSHRSPRQVLDEALWAVPNLGKLLWRLTRDERVPIRPRLFVGAALAYAVLPVDLVPDVIPLIGRLDDLVVLALALRYLVEAAGDDVVQEHWDGGGEVLELAGVVLEATSGLVPWPVRRGVKRLLLAP